MIRWCKQRVRACKTSPRAARRAARPGKLNSSLRTWRRASLEELRLDYEDFLRHRGLVQWAREDARRAELIARRCATADAVAVWARDVRDGLHGQHGQSGLRGHGKSGQKSTQSTESTRSAYAEIAANGVLALIAVACSLLDRQIASLGKTFVDEGGFTERLYRVRSEHRR